MLKDTRNTRNPVRFSRRYSNTIATANGKLKVDLSRDKKKERRLCIMLYEQKIVEVNKLLSSENNLYNDNLLSTSFGL